MGRLVYSAIVSLDGYVVDADGSFAWAAPDEQVHAFVNDRQRSVASYLLGRRMYEVMAVWDDPDAFPDPSDVELDFARLWQAAEKIVYSTTLTGVSTGRTRLERTFDVDAVRRMVRAAEGDVSVSGPGLAAHAIRAGLVEEWEVYVVPVVVGGGTPYLPDGVRVRLELTGEHRFDNGTVHLRYRTAR